MDIQPGAASGLSSDVPGPEVFYAALTDEETQALSRAAGRCVGQYAQAGPDGFVATARRSATSLPPSLVHRLRRFGRDSGRAGALLLRGLPVFGVPPTPTSPAACAAMTVPAAGVLGIIAAMLGEQYGFEPETAGQIIQDILPVRGLEREQQSVSSDVMLFTHAELAFLSDSDRPNYIALLCLRADHDGVAATTVSSIETILPLVPPWAVDVLRQPRYETTVDANFLPGLGHPGPLFVGPFAILPGIDERLTVRADFAETSGLDDEAQAALRELRNAAETVAVPLRLAAGDLVILDNQKVFHGRTPFAARWDGADRWLLRTYITKDLTRSAGRRPGGGRVVEIRRNDLGPSRAGSRS